MKLLSPTMEKFSLNSPQGPGKKGDCIRLTLFEAYWFTVPFHNCQTVEAVFTLKGDLAIFSSHLIKKEAQSPLVRLRWLLQSWQCHYSVNTAICCSIRTHINRYTCTHTHTQFIYTHIGWCWCYILTPALVFSSLYGVNTSLYVISDSYTMYVPLKQQSRQHKKQENSD